MGWEETFKSVIPKRKIYQYKENSNSKIDHSLKLSEMNEIK